MMITYITWVRWCGGGAHAGRRRRPPAPPTATPPPTRPPIDAPCTHCLRHGDPMHAQKRLTSAPRGDASFSGIGHCAAHTDRRWREYTAAGMNLNVGESQPLLLRF
eukprot:COSAG01_NODE_23_length_37704_cov_30.005877_48_plen_106_part_00